MDIIDYFFDDDDEVNVPSTPTSIEVAKTRKAQWAMFATAISLTIVVAGAVTRVAMPMILDVARKEWQIDDDRLRSERSTEFTIRFTGVNESLHRIELVQDKMAEKIDRLSERVK